jgi:hypothetical protein
MKKLKAIDPARVENVPLIMPEIYMPNKSYNVKPAKPGSFS